MGLFDALRSPPRRPATEEEAPSGVELSEDLSNSSSASELLSNHEVSAVHAAYIKVVVDLRAASSGCLTVSDDLLWLQVCITFASRASLAASLSWCALEQVHAAPGMDLSGAERLYNPYEGLSTALDARAGLPRNLYRLPEQPEFLFSEEAGVHKRSWSENLTYYTGLGYLSGAVHTYSLLQPSPC